MTELWHWYNHIMIYGTKTDKGQEKDNLMFAL